ncbi:hypothetical protein NDU88_002776 [Pleurodeles waltl]|uniref:Uncharacterized protein n=1 Tax=Pleurodeles waltl TaxID=8319 RepID=A0AAV7WM49_PLEWA|nr:hypothetical protein NDU88_002776 [Pleurodeles waltl]
MDRAPRGMCVSAPKHPDLAALWPLSQPQSRSFAQLGVAAVAQLLGHHMGKSCFAAAGSRDIRLQRLCRGGGVASGPGTLKFKEGQWMPQGFDNS